MKILAIETSCDETAAAVVEDGRKILSNVVYTQMAEHAIYGGVVPEIASRRHTEQIAAVTRRALSDAGLALPQIDAVAVTAMPGLIGALLVGVSFAKGLAYAAGVPLIPVNHLRGHIAANYLAFPELAPPFLCLVVSGGHTEILQVEEYTHFRRLGATRDDAAGEAFDKAARAMGLPYPGGVALDRLAESGDPLAYALPQPHVEGSVYDMSFSGLKTAMVNLLHNAEQRGLEIQLPDAAASFRAAVVEILAGRFEAAAAETGAGTLVTAGGVSANAALRRRLTAACARRGWRLFMPPLSLTGDNAAMIGAQAYYEFLDGARAELSLNASANAAL